MSTRGAIALPSRNGWWGRYHHFDSYLTGLGNELFRLYHQTFDRDHREMAAVLIEQHPAGWSTIMAGSTAEGPHTRTDFDQCGFTDIGSPVRGSYPECYCHGTRAEPEDRLVCRCPSDATGCDPVWIEWAYVLTPHEMLVLTSWHPDPEVQLSTHRLIAPVAWENEPDWDTVEDRAWQPQPHAGRA